MSFRWQLVTIGVPRLLTPIDIVPIRLEGELKVRL
jgi:hypothetical protein